MVIREIPLADVEGVEASSLDPKRLDELADDAAFDAAVSDPDDPVTLAAPGPPYAVVSGRHRVHAARERGHTHVKARCPWLEDDSGPAPDGTLARRKAILDEEVRRYVKKGWRVEERDDTSAQLVKDKSPSCLLALILAIFFILPAILYLLLYKGTESLYIEVDEDGEVHTTRR